MHKLLKAPRKTLQALVNKRDIALLLLQKMDPNITIVKNTAGFTAFELAEKLPEIIAPSYDSSNDYPNMLLKAKESHERYPCRPPAKMADTIRSIDSTANARCYRGDSSDLVVQPLSKDPSNKG